MAMTIRTPLLALLLAAPAMAADKYLIEFGWDEPTTAFMRSHVVEMEKTPFDGTVYHLEARNPDGSPSSFMNLCWGKRAFTQADLQPAEDNLRATRFTTFAHNFLRFNVCPADLDWFDDYSAVMNNARLAARIAAATGAAGILFDVEQYNAPLWEYPKQKLAGTKSFADYSAQAESKGADLVRAFQEGWAAGGSKRPLVIFQTYGYSLPRQEAEGSRARLDKISYGLLAPFMDGMLGAASPSTQIVDGFEFSYSYKSPSQFADARDLVFKKLPDFVKDKSRYLQHTSLSFGLWMDYDWRNKGWDESDPSKNFFTPAQFESSLKQAVQAADRYVWIYTEKPQWWTPAGAGAAHLPAAYVEAVRHAKATIAR